MSEKNGRPDELAGLFGTAERSQQLLETAPDAIVVVDGLGRIVLANQQTGKLFGYAQQGLLGQPIESLIPERFRDQHREHLRRYCGNPTVRPMGAGLELYGRRRDGSEFPVEISLSPIRIEGQLLVSSAIRDVTQQRELQTRLRQALQDAESAAAGKTRFIAAASHDLRQPLQAAALYLEIATGGTLDRSQLDETLRKTKRCVDSLRSLLDKILHISKLDAGTVTPELQSVPLTELFHRLEEQFRPAAEAAGLELRVVPPRVLVRTDPVLLRQLLENLVSNALRYTERGGVLLGCRRRGSRLHIQVWDTGIGIPEDQLESVFEEFRQLQKVGHGTERGLGLGLSIVRRLAELLGHRIRLRSELGRGTMFEVVLPLAASVAEQPAAAPRAAQPSHLVAALDDEPAVLDALQAVLHFAGYRVIAESTIEALLGRLRREGLTPGALVTDYRLGESATGLDALEVLRAEYGQRLEAIVLTGDSSFQVLTDRSRTERFGVLAKPIDGSTLTRELARRLASQGT